MNEDAREEQSVVGKAVSTVTVGGGIYGAHRGLRSDTAYNWGAKKAGQGSYIGKGILKYNEKAEDLKSKMQNAYDRRYGNDNFYYDFKSYDGDREGVHRRRSSSRNVDKISGREAVSRLKAGLDDEALANQVHLDNLRNATRAGKKVKDVATTPKVNKIITSKLDDYAKSVVKIK